MFWNYKHRGDLMQHSEKKTQTSKTNCVHQLIENLDFVHPNAHTASQRASQFILVTVTLCSKMTIKKAGA